MKKEQSKRLMIAIIVFVSFFMLIQQISKSPYLVMSIERIIKVANQQPTECFEFNLQTYCPGEPGFVLLFNCNRNNTNCPMGITDCSSISCPTGMTCNPNGMCEIDNPKIDYTPLFIVGIILLIWVFKGKSDK